jgi:hypothetical protein
MNNALLVSTPKTYPASLLLNFDGSFSDSSSYTQTVANSGGFISSTQSKFGGSSLFLDGSVGSYISIPNNSAMQLGNDPFTIEAWIYPIRSQAGVIIEQCVKDEGYGNNTGWFLYMQNGNPRFYLLNEGVQPCIAPTLVNPVLNRWGHIALVRNGNNFTIYIDGTSVGQYNISYNMNAALNLRPDTPTLIGQHEIQLGESNFQGFIDNLRITKGVALYQGNYFTPSSSSLSKNATIAPKLYNHIVMTSTKSSGDITGYVSTSSGYYTVNWWDGTKTTYASGATFAKASIGGNQSITIYPSSSNGSLDGYFYNVNVSNNNLTSVRPFYSNFISSPGINATFTSWRTRYSNGVGYVGYTYTGNIYTPGTPYNLDISSNSLDTSALNQIYTDLLNGNGSIDVSDNTGGDSDNPSIATTKGYTVYGSLAPILSTLFNFDGANNSTTFTDSSSYNHVPTRFGNTIISTTQSKFGGSSAYFDGTGDYLSIATNSVFAMGKEDFTVECWVYPTSWPTSDLGAIVENRSSASSGGFLLWLGNDQKWVLYVSSDGNAVQRAASSVDNATLNTWTHLVGVRKNGKLYLYVNGSLVASTGVDGSPDDLSPSNTSPIRIGTAIDNPGNSRMFYGHIDGLKIVKGKALYTDDFVVPSSAPTTSTATISSGVTRLLLNCNGANNSTTFTDSSSAARTVTRTNTVISTTQSQWSGGSSAYFSNSGTDALAVTNNFNLSNTDYTIEFFFYLINQSGATNGARLFSIESSNGQTYGVLLNQSTPNFASYNLYGTSTAVDLNSTSFSYATWYHFAMSKDYNTYRFFLNGSLIGSGVGSYTPTGNVVLTIGGSRLNYPYNKLNAYMDDFRVITGKALYTSNFTPPTSQLTVYP